MTSHDEPVEKLGESDCWSLLRTVALGRLAVATPDGVDIFPINFVVDHGTVVFRSATGTKLSAVLTGERVAFEADGAEAATGRLWSVVIHGTAAEITDLDETIEALTLPLRPAQASNKPRLLRITPLSTTGRRFNAADPARWAPPKTLSPPAPHE